MNKEPHPQLSTILDILIAIFIALTGIFTILFGLTWSNFIESLDPGTLKNWLDNTPWILNFIGLATILYGIKRLLYNLHKIKK